MFVFQEKNLSSVNSTAVTGVSPTAVTGRSTCTFTRLTSHICANCATSLTLIPAP